MPELTRIAKSEIRLRFFDLMFGDSEGYLCIATKNRSTPNANFTQRFFEWPKQSKFIENYILKVERNNDVYFCVNLLSKQERKKDNCLPTFLLWADLDQVNPDSIAKIPPTITVRTSPGRWQAFWRMSTKIPPFQAEEYCRRIAYLVGADKSGWDLTQLCRVPHTLNFKYKPPTTVIPERMLETTAPPLIFEALPSDILLAVPEPQLDKDISAENVIYKYSPLLGKTAFYALYTQEPEGEWSGILWRLIHECLKVGMTPEETFVVTREARCNKYARDGRPIEHLWRDVRKAADSYESIEFSADLVSMPELVDDKTDTFIDTYRRWASDATDAVVDFHDLSIFIILSAIISSSVRLETSAGSLTPNLWGMILGDSTLTRKTTAMRLAIDFLISMDAELLLATDGTPEGLLTGLSTRPNKSSIFYKDEVSGFFDGMNRREYLAGMQETLTALYDVPPIYTRRLRKETIVIESPSFIILSGGVTERVYSSINEQYVLSGFLPRFLVVSGEAVIEDRRALGPPTEQGLVSRASIFNKLGDLYERYAGDVNVKIGNQSVRMPARITAKLTPEAWTRNAEIEFILLKAGKDSLIEDLALPTFNRMSRSLLKMAVILGAIRQVPKNEEIIIEVEDVNTAAWYIQRWGHNSIELMMNAGKHANEKFLERIQQTITNNPGILRSNLMRHHRMDSKQAALILQTLEDRGEIRKESRGRGFAYWIA